MFLIVTYYLLVSGFMLLHAYTVHTLGRRDDEENDEEDVEVSNKDD